MSEAATANRRGFLSSFRFHVTLISSDVLAQLALSSSHSACWIVMPSRDWGWRIGFFIGGIAAYEVLYGFARAINIVSESDLKDVREGQASDADERWRR